MPTYISLMKFTEQGIRNVKDHPKRRENAAKGIESMGGKLLHTYLTMGRYDIVAIIEAPDDDVAAKFALIRCTSPGAAIRGGIVSTTMNASAAAKPSSSAHSSTPAPGVTTMPSWARAIRPAEPRKPRRPVSRRSQTATTGAVKS